MMLITVLWSNAGQMLVKCWSNADQMLVRLP
jgi:hypothetical protein